MADHSNQASEGQPGFVPAALFGLCPQCGSRTLFDGVAKFAPRCRSCGLDLGQFNVGDGPAAFLTLLIGAVTLGLALWLEFSWHPPVWVHALVWIPFVAGTTIWGLRIGKAALLVTEYQRDAGEGRLKQP
ncbi:DUF983 domain-containing protein [Novosphingobium sp.]|uniref:DUF983 domain-containing protein n=1 Tax=Novosphingobium sp. TaxID=1874826 RepID=UPI0027377C04|nr:DUF983 domain-containing protein [Novosphingobium sp.]MDP3908133.1 DUF983 domain-containing protein [Novosphingobium sp.]